MIDFDTEEPRTSPEPFLFRRQQYMFAVIRDDFTDAVALQGWSFLLIHFFANIVSDYSHNGRQNRK